MRYIIILILLTLCSCNANKIVLKNKTELAKKCIEEFPTKETYIKGDTITIVDTFERIEVQKCIDIITRDTITLKCKDIIKTIKTTDTIIKIDSSFNYIVSSDLRLKEAEISALNSKIDKEIANKKTWRKIALISSSIVLLSITLKLAKKYYL